MERSDPTPPIALHPDHPCHLLRHSNALLHQSYTPSPSFLRRQEPTCPHPTPTPIHPSPLLGGRLGGGWNAAIRRRQSRYTPIAHATPSVTPTPPSITPTPSSISPTPPLRHSCAGRNLRPPAPLRAATPRRPIQATSGAAGCLGWARRVPACAGMTEREGAGVAVGGVDRRFVSLEDDRGFPPPT